MAETNQTTPCPPPRLKAVIVVYDTGHGDEARLIDLKKVHGITWCHGGNGGHARQTPTRGGPPRPSKGGQEETDASTSNTAASLGGTLDAGESESAVTHLDPPICWWDGRRWQCGF